MLADRQASRAHAIGQKGCVQIRATQVKVLDTSSNLLLSQNIARNRSVANETKWCVSPSHLKTGRASQHTPLERMLDTNFGVAIIGFALKAYAAGSSFSYVFFLGNIPDPRRTFSVRS